MSKPPEQGLKRVAKATRYSLQGLRSAWRNEAAFRQEAITALAMLPVAFWLASSPLELSLLIGVLGLVLVVELLNSAIEAVVDRVGEEHNELSGRAKDMGSAAVFIALLLAGFVWVAVIGERFVLPNLPR